MSATSVCRGVLFFSLVSSLTFAGWREMLWDPDQNNNYSDADNWTFLDGDETKVGIPNSEDTIVFSGEKDFDCLIENGRTVRDIQIDLNYTKNIRIETTATSIGQLYVGEPNVQRTSYLEGGNILLEEDTVFEVGGKHILELNGTQILEENEAGELDPGTFKLSDTAKVMVLGPYYNEIDAKVEVTDDSVLEINGGQLDLRDNKLDIDDDGKVTLLSGDAAAGPTPEALVAAQIYFDNGSNGTFEIKSMDHVTIDSVIQANDGNVVLDLDTTELTANFMKGIWLNGGDMKIESGDISLPEEELLDVAWNSSLIIASSSEQWIIGDVKIEGSKANTKFAELVFTTTPNVGYGHLVIDGDLEVNHGVIGMTQRYFNGDFEEGDFLRITGDFIVGDDGAILNYDHVGTREGSAKPVLIRLEGEGDDFTEIIGLANNEWGIDTIGTDTIMYTQVP